MGPRLSMLVNTLAPGLGDLRQACHTDNVSKHNLLRVNGRSIILVHLLHCSTQADVTAKGESVANLADIAGTLAGELRPHSIRHMSTCVLEAACDCICMSLQSKWCAQQGE